MYHKPRAKYSQRRIPMIPANVPVSKGALANNSLQVVPAIEPALEPRGCLSSGRVSVK